MRVLWEGGIHARDDESYKRNHRDERLRDREHDGWEMLSRRMRNAFRGVQLSDRIIYVSGAKEYIQSYGRERGVKFKIVSAKTAREKISDEECVYCQDTLYGLKDSDKVLMSIIDYREGYHASARIRKN